MDLCPHGLSRGGHILLGQYVADVLGLLIVVLPGDCLPISHLPHLPEGWLKTLHIYKA